MFCRWSAIVDAGLLDVELPQAGGNPSLAVVPVTDYLAMALSIGQMLVGVDSLGDFRLNGRGEHLLSS